MKVIRAQVQSSKLYNQYSLKKYNDNYYKLVLLKYPIDVQGYELEIDTDEFNVYDEKLENSISRTRSKIFEIAMCNQFDYFVTLTLNKDKHDRYDLNAYIASLGQFIRDYRKKTGCNVQYLLIPEKHANGAYHMHGLLKGIKEKDKRLFTLKDNIPEKIKNMIRDGRMIYNWVPYANKFGWVTLEKVRKVEAVSRYITKYIKKSVGTTVIELNKKSYYCSRGLKKAEVIKKGTFPTLPENAPKFNYENDYIRIMDLNKEDLEQLLALL